MDLRKMYSQVVEFNDVFGVEKYDGTNFDKLKEVRYRLLKEEIDEYINAVKNNDLVEQADGLVDCMYIILGTFYLFGIDADSVINYMDDDDCISYEIHYLELANNRFFETNEYYYSEYDISLILDRLYSIIEDSIFHDKFDQLFDEVHRSNMSKLDENGKPIINDVNCPHYDPSLPIGKVLKPITYGKPDLAKILNS